MFARSSDGCLVAMSDANADRHAAGLLKWLVRGVLIDINPFTGKRIFPLADYGFVGPAKRPGR